MKKPSNTADLRVRRTRKSLKDAYVKLAARHKRSEMNVTLVTQEAMINRKTFYGHFSSIEELLDAVEKDIAEKTVKRILITGGGYQPGGAAQGTS